MTKTTKTNQFHVRLFHRFGAFLLGVLILVTAFFFQNQPFTNLGTPESPTPHWAVTLNAFCNDGFLRDVWFGVDLPPAAFTGERILATGLGIFVVVTLFFLGRLLFAPFKKSLIITEYETWFFAGVLGLIFISLEFQIAGLLRHASLPILLQTFVIFVVGLTSTIISFVRTKKTKLSANKNNVPAKPSSHKCVLTLQVLLLALFVSFYFFSASQPIFEYDALEYHTQGAREIYETGSIDFSPVNVYLNMPLGAEMYYVTGLNFVRDIGLQGTDTLRLGLLIGKTILVAVPLLIAFGLICFCVRFFNSLDGGLWSAIVFLSFPNLFEVCSNGLNEGTLALSLFAVCYAVFLAFDSQKSVVKSRDVVAVSTLLGLFAGFAAAVKYTGVIFISIPTFIAISALLLRPVIFPSVAHKGEEDKETNLRYQRRSYFALTALSLTTFVLAASLVCGGWYIKNYVASGNPVYPLCYGVFGDETGEWNEAINLRWQKAHSPTGFNGSELGKAVAHAFWKDDFGSPLYIYVSFIGVITFFGVFHPRIALERRKQTQRLLALFVFVVIFGAAWFFLTHRLTRFLLPLSPLFALLLGLGVSASFKAKSLTLKSIVTGTLLFSLFYSGLLIDILGQGRLAPLRALENDPDRFPAVALFFNNHPELLSNADGNTTQGKKLLLVGDAKACAYHVPVLYSTCWNNSPLVSIINEGVNRDANGKITGVFNADAIKNAFVASDVAYISVDFRELARFRSDGNYGFNNPEIDENLFLMLMQAGIIEPFSPDELNNDIASTQVFKVTGF